MKVGSLCSVAYDNAWLYQPIPENDSGAFCCARKISLDEVLLIIEPTWKVNWSFCRVLISKGEVGFVIRAYLREVAS